jgi:putative ABC transport system ATP-binding protein
VIVLRGVSKQFDGKRKVTALEHVDLTIGRGEMVAIVGPSGSGKSTMLNLIGALDHATEGEIEIDGMALSSLNDDDVTRVRRDKIGFIFQFFNLLPTLTCLENVSLPLHLGGWARKEIDARARELLKLVQLSERLDHLPDELSGGERQRVAIRAGVERVSSGAAGRRADRQPGFHHRLRNFEVDSRSAPVTGCDRADGDARYGGGRKLRADHSHPRRQDC